MSSLSNFKFFNKFFNKLFRMSYLSNIKETKPTQTTPVDEGTTVIIEDDELMLTRVNVRLVPESDKQYNLGDTATVTCMIENTGNVDLTNIRYQCELSGDEWHLDVLQAGTKVTNEVSYVITESDCMAGELVFTLTGKADTPDPNNPELVFSENLSVGVAGIVTELKVSAVGAPEYCTSGQTINMMLQVENVGNTTVSNIKLSCERELTGNTWNIESLAPSEMKQFSVSYTPTENDIGNIKFDWNVSGYDVEGNMYTDEGNITVPKHHKLTINYFSSTGSMVVNPYTNYYNTGDSYNVTSPVLSSYRCDKPTVSGTITHDTIVNVTYSKNVYTLTINYMYMNGTMAAPKVTRNVSYGESYSIPSPVIAGYTAQPAVMDGKMPARNVTYTVYYVSNPIIIEDLDTPL